MWVQETSHDTTHWLSGSIFIKVRLAPGRHAPAAPANWQGSRPSASLLPQPPTHYPTPENWFPWLHLSVAFHIYGSRGGNHTLKVAFLPALTIWCLKPKSWISLPVFSLSSCHRVPLFVLSLLFKKEWAFECESSPNNCTACQMYKTILKSTNWNIY